MALTNDCDFIILVVKIFIVKYNKKELNINTLFSNTECKKLKFQILVYIYTQIIIYTTISQNSALYINIVIS